MTSDQRIHRQRALFIAIGFTPKNVEALLVNENASNNLETVIGEAGISMNGCKESLGRMLITVSEQVKPTPFALVNRKFMLQCIANGTIATQPQLVAAIAFFKKNTKQSPDTFNIEEFKQKSGVGVVVTAEDIQQAVQNVVHSYTNELVEKRYWCSLGPLLGKLRVVLPFADSKLVASELNNQIALLLGPKTPSDEVRPKLDKSKAKAKAREICDSKKSAAVNEDNDVVAKTLDDIERLYTGREIVAAVNPPDILVEHKRITGGQIRTRFPPEPNGFLHLGHAKAMNFNFGFAQAKGGTTYLRFDDTNPSAEDKIFIESIKENASWLGHKPSSVTYSSEYFEQLYSLAIELIKLGKAYVCHWSSDEVKAARALKLEQPASPWRNTSVQQNLIQFERMRLGMYEEGEVSLRMKIDIRHPNPCMWDPIAYRIKYETHPHIGDKWCIYPSYDYTHCIVDSIEHITQSLCTLEFEIRRDSYYWLLEALNLYRPMVWEYSRLNVTYNVMSKRKLKLLVDDKYVDGWDDPRLLTINGLRRRGYTPSAINEFCARVGVTRAPNMISVELLEACVRAELDEAAPRTMVVLEPLMIQLTNVADDEQESIRIPNHPKHDAGEHTANLSRIVYIERTDFRLEDNQSYYGLAPGKTVRLKLAYAIKCEKVIYDDDGNVVSLECSLDKSDTKRYKGVLHWVSGLTPLTVEVREYHSLFKVADPGTLNDWLSEINPQSLILHPTAKADVSLIEAKVYDRYQFERVGYFVVDPDTSRKSKVFNMTVSLRESKTKREM